MSNDTTQHTPADVRERVAKEVYVWEHVRRGAEESWARQRWQTETDGMRDLYFETADRILALLRTPRGEGEAMDADEIWNHWTSGHEDAALQGLRTATDDEAHRFLGMVADWQRCPKPSDHDAIAALLSEAPVGVLDKLRELICDVAASGVAFEDERLDYLEIQIDRQTWDEVCALAARQQGGSE